MRPLIGLTTHDETVISSSQYVANVYRASAVVEELVSDRKVIHMLRNSPNLCDF